MEFSMFYYLILVPGRTFLTRRLLWRNKCFLESISEIISHRCQSFGFTLLIRCWLLQVFIHILDMLIWLEISSCMCCTIMFPFTQKIVIGLMNRIFIIGQIQRIDSMSLVEFSIFDCLILFQGRTFLTNILLWKNKSFLESISEIISHRCQSFGFTLFTRCWLL